MLAALWQTSLTTMSAELEGHALGGGLLKIEPSEAEKTLVPCPALGVEGLEALVEALDGRLRAGDLEGARDLADEAILRKGLGLSQGDCQLVREATAALRQRRCSKGRG